MDFDVNLLLLVGVGFVAGIINTLAGGGSLLTLPILIFMGLPEAIANGTNRIALVLQTGTAVAGFKSKGVGTFPFSIYVAIPACIGAFIGARFAIDIDGKLFNKILSVVMLVVMFLIVFTKKKQNLSYVTERTKGKHLYISMVVFFFIGIYGGFLNAGAGFVMLLVLPFINQLSLVKSNATKVTVVFIYMIVSLGIFILHNKVNWKLGLTMALGNILGAWISSRYAVKKGDQFIRIVLLVVVVFLSFKLWFF